MNETSLSKTIDTLAKRKAEAFITQIKADVNAALQKHFRPKIANEQFCGDVIREVLLAYGKSIGTNQEYVTPKPSAELINDCRATILKDLLNGLPKIRELLAMEDSNDGNKRDG